MKVIKTLIAASALAIVSAADATVWTVEMNTSIYFPAANGPLNMAFHGTYNDASNTGSWSGTTTIPGFATTLHYTQTFTMDETTGLGRLNPLDLGTCTANTASACLGLEPSFQGVLKNTAVNSATPNDYQNNLPFVPNEGWSGQWTLQIFRPVVNEEDEVSIVFMPIPMNVCLHGLADCPSVVPLPSTAWLFGSSLVGVLAAARKRWRN